MKRREFVRSSAARRRLGRLLPVRSRPNFSSEYCERTPTTGMAAPNDAGRLSGGKRPADATHGKGAHRRGAEKA